MTATQRGLLSGLFVAALAVMLLVGAGAAGAAGADGGNATVSVEELPAGVEPGDEIEFDVVVASDGPAVADLEFLLEYDDAVVDVTDVEAVDFTNDDNWIEVGPSAEHGEIDYASAWAGEADDTLSTEGIAVTVTAVVDDGAGDGDVAAFSFASATTQDTDGNEIQTEPIGDELVVDAEEDDPDDPESPEPSPPPIEASVSADTTTVEELENVALDASDSEGAGELTFDWEFGDGESANDTDAVIEHAYGEAGTYTVTLTVTDEEDQTATDEIEIEVTEPTEDEAPGFGAVAAVLALIVATLVATRMRET